MKVERITEVGALTPGTTFIEVEACGDGPFFQVNGPYEIVTVPSNGYVPRMWPLASRYWMEVRKTREKDSKRQETLRLSVPSEDGVTIVRKPRDYSAFFLYTPEVEKKLREFEALNEYSAYAIDMYRALAKI